MTSQMNLAKKSITQKDVVITLQHLGITARDVHEL